MKKYIIIPLLLIANIAISQITIGNGATMRLHNGAKVIVMNPIPNGINGGGTGGIITMGEDAQVILKLNNSTGNFNIPFSTENGTAIPFSYNITTAGSSTGEIRFSSWGTDADNDPLPVGVTSFTDNSGSPNEYYVIDRFWKIEPVGYTSKPEGEYIFTYDVNEITFPNTIVENQLVAQRWNDYDDLWGDWLYSNTANTINKTVSVIISNVEDQYPIWTLVDNSDLLPIGLVIFVGHCDGDKVNISWTTYTEINNLYFVLEKSKNGYIFEEIAQINGAVNSNSINQYEYSDDDPNAINYYRLKNISTEGDISYSQIINVLCTHSDIKVFPNPTNGGVTITGITDHIIEIFDVKGSLISTKNIIKDLSVGKYIMVIRNNIDYKIFKIIKK